MVVQHMSSVTAARNERAFIQATLDSVVTQIILPLKWIIVSDESTDGTDELIGRYAAASEFIRLIQIESKAKRDFRSKVLSVKLGVALLSGLDYDYFANVDADVSFSADYFCRVLSYMEEEKRLGIGGGILLEPFSGGWVKQLLAPLGVSADRSKYSGDSATKK